MYSTLAIRRTKPSANGGYAANAWILFRNSLLLAFLQVIRGDGMKNHDAENALHQKARDFMDAHHKPGWKLLSLDEWLFEYGDHLTEGERKDGYELLDQWHV